jgi:biotin carboxyl carrier protein
MPGKDERAPSGRGAAAVTGGGSARVTRDHAAISRLADDLLPALIAKLGASGLGEIEVREGEWKARLRKPAGAGERQHSGPLAARPATPHAPAKPDEGKKRSEESEAAAANLPIMATSPAVGVFQARKGIDVGSRVRAGDRIGFVDVLGVREDVVSPIDGVVGIALIEPGEAVEYGQELIRIELPENAHGIDAGAGDRQAAAVLGEA